jgi:hypothetical protein
VAEWRAEIAVEHAALDAAFAPIIDAHLAAYTRAIDDVVAAHRAVADKTDLGDSR